MYTALVFSTNPAMKKGLSIKRLKASLVSQIKAVRAARNQSELDSVADSVLGVLRTISEYAQSEIHFDLYDEVIREIRLKRYFMKTSLSVRTIAHKYGVSKSVRNRIDRIFVSFHAFSVILFGFHFKDLESVH